MWEVDSSIFWDKKGVYIDDGSIIKCRTRVGTTRYGCIRRRCIEFLRREKKRPGEGEKERARERERQRKRETG